MPAPEATKVGWQDKVVCCAVAACSLHRSAGRPCCGLGSGWGQMAAVAAIQLRWLPGVCCSFKSENRGTPALAPATTHTMLSAVQTGF